MDARERTRNITGIFHSINVGAMNASSTLVYNFADRHPALAKYLPFDSITITNNSSADLLVKLNMDNDKQTPVPAGSIKTISGYGIHSLIITNDANAIVSGELRIDCERTGATVDRVSKAIADNVFFKALFPVGGIV